LGARGTSNEPPAASPAGADGGGDGQPNRKPFLLRLPRDLHDELRAWADAELRSLNAHLEYVLREAVRRRRSKPKG